MPLDTQTYIHTYFVAHIQARYRCQQHTLTLGTFLLLQVCWCCNSGVCRHLPLPFLPLPLFAHSRLRGVKQIAKVANIFTLIYAANLLQRNVLTVWNFFDKYKTTFSGVSRNAQLSAVGKWWRNLVMSAIVEKFKLSKEVGGAKFAPKSWSNSYGRYAICG